MWRKLGITARISILFIIVIVILILMSGLAMYINIYNIFRERVVEDLTQLSLQIKYNIDAIISGVDQATMHLYTDATIIEALSNSNLSASQIYESIRMINNQLYNLSLNNVLSSYNTSFFLGENIPLARKIPSSSFLYSGVYSSSSILETDWYKKAVENDGTLYLSIIHDKHQVPYICFSRLIKNCLSSKQVDISSDGDERLGVATISFDIYHIGNLLDEAKLTPNSQIIFTSEEGSILYSTNEEVTGSNISEHTFSSFANNYSETGTYIEKYRDDHYLVNSLILRSNCHLLTIIPMSDITQRVAIIRQIVIMACIVSAVIGIFLTLLISNSVTRPIRTLAGVMSGIQNQENLDMYLEPPSNDEVGVLYESFNSMMSRITKLIDDVYETGRKQREAEIKALESQINPHFLYNTLDSVNWLALSAGANDISEIISSLSELLRYSIKNENELIAIKEEKIQLKNYINIQKMCYEDSFDVVFSIDENLMTTKIPKLVLQPLVENSILHGISKISCRGYIEIKGYTKGNKKVIITVEDNGQNFDVKYLNNILRLDKHIKEKGGHGIRNVDQRIKLHFGEEYGLHYEVSVYGGAKAIVELPYKGEYMMEVIL